jgi:probable phosphoglycerate mutase
VSGKYGGNGRVADLSLVFDGGSKGNPGLGYGSFRLTVHDGASEIARLEFGDRITNNQAEYRTFIAGLEQALDRARALGRQPGDLAIQVRTDSKLVVEQVCGRWKVRHAELQPLRERARVLLDQFGRADLAWHPRTESVKILGH